MGEPVADLDRATFVTLTPTVDCERQILPHIRLTNVIQIIFEIVERPDRVFLAISSERVTVINYPFSPAKPARSQRQTRVQR